MRQSFSGWQSGLAGVRQRQREMVDGLVQMPLGRNRASGAERITGQGRFVVPKTLAVTRADGGGTRTLRGQRVVLSTGRRATVEDACLGCGRAVP